MSEILQLNHQSENTYEFVLDIDGINSTSVRAWFVLDTNGVELSFPCSQSDKNFKAIIPAIPYIERSTYKAYIRIAVDSHFFEPVNDLLVNVVGNLNLGERNIKDIKLTPSVKPRFEDIPSSGKKKVESKPKKKMVEEESTNIVENKNSDNQIIENSSIDTLVKKVVSETKTPKVDTKVEVLDEAQSLDIHKETRKETEKDKATRLILEQQRTEMAKKPKIERAPHVRKTPVKVSPGVSLPENFFRKTDEVAVAETTEVKVDPIADARNQREDKIKNILGSVRSSKESKKTDSAKFKKLS